MIIDQSQLVAEFSDLVAIDAPSRRERAMFEAMRQRLEALGFVVREDDAGERTGGQCGNLYAWLDGSGGTPETDAVGAAGAVLDPVLFSAHLDTVQPCIGKKAILGGDGVLRSDGTTILGADNVAALVEILAGVRAALASGLRRRPIEILFSVAEELHVDGIRHARPDWLRARRAYVLDAIGSAGLAISSAPGKIGFDVTVRGRSAHAGMEPERGISAITVAAQAIAGMPLGRVDAQTTANIGTIEAKYETNVVADRCRVRAECRSHTDARLLAQADAMEQCFRTAAAAAGATVEIRRSLDYRPYAVAPEAPSVQAFRAVCAQLGLPFRFAPAGGGSDNNQFVLWGIDGLVLANGMTDSHSCQESIRVQDLVDLARIVAQLCLEPAS